MFKSYSKIIFILLSWNICFIYADNFSEGPYGTNYFDIAGPFTVPDLNASFQGDANIDGIINIQDVILLVNEILGNSSLNDEQFDQADVNDDNIIDVLDVVAVVNRILYPQLPEWDFEENWTGDESYIFIQFDVTVASSNTLWGSSTNYGDDLLSISPDNVHYFFISNRTQYEEDVQQMKDLYDGLLSNLSQEEQNHWSTHLHFINEKTISLNNWLEESLNGEYAIAIDPFQQIRQIGYLGNPASFTGTYVNYLAHEALYFNHELEIFSNTGEEYDEITIFERTHYTGGWASSISHTLSIPYDLSNYDRLEVELLRGCPDSNMNYDDDGCDDYDRIAHMYLCEGQCYETIYYGDADESACIEGGNLWDADLNICYSIHYNELSINACMDDFTMTWDPNRECHEMARWITPFDRQPHSLTDITPFLSSLRSNAGQDKIIKFQESGWPNSLLTLKLRLYNGDTSNGSAQEIYPIWNGTVQFNPDYGENRPTTVFTVPSNATKVEFVSYITGHGWGSAGCFNCCEFCNSRHQFSVNGGVYEFNQEFPDASSSNHCMNPNTIESTGVIPNQYGTWGYGRAGWCPGRDVEPYIMDITDFISIGDENVIDYTACRVSGNSCVSPPTCAGDGYCPEIAMSSYIIISY